MYFSITRRILLLSIMNLIILLIYTPLVYTELHTFTTTYTGITGSKGIPEFFAVSTLNDQQMDYYDSINQTLIYKQKWLEKDAAKWIKYSVKRRKAQDTYNNSIYEIMAKFNQSGGIHTYQRICSCSWESETDESDWFDMYGYDGEDFIKLDLNESTYISHMPQALPTLQKLNNNTSQESVLHHKFFCVHWLKKFLRSAYGTFNRTVLPEVSLLQKKLLGPVVCHATGFYPQNATITWRKNGEELNSQLVKLGEHLPNEDGTFQINATLNMKPEDWKKDQYICVVEHKSWTKNIQKILSEDEIKRNNNSGAHINKIVLVLVIVVGVAVVYRVLAHCYVSKQMKTIQEKTEKEVKALLCQNTTFSSTESDQFKDNK